MSIFITVPGTPVGKGRPRVTRHGTYTPQKTKDYESLIEWSWAKQSKVRIPDGTPIAIKILAFFPIPKSYPKKKACAAKGTPYMKKPDIDNIVKSVLDGLQGCAFKDDSQVYRISAVKFYSDNPRLKIEIEY